MILIPIHEHGDPTRKGPYPHGGGKGAEQSYIDEEGLTRVGDLVELYHGTSKRRARAIQKQGFRIRAVRKQTMGGDPESSRDYVWFAKKRGSAQGYAEMHSGATVVTIRIPYALYKKLNPYGRNSGPQSVWIKQAIPAKYIHSIS